MNIIVDDRRFVIGLTELYRSAMKAYEVVALLPLAETLAKALKVPPSADPVEGYYYESSDLTRYFRLVRGLQNTELKTIPQGAMPSFDRLREVFSSPAVGRVESTSSYWPTAQDFEEAVEYVLPRMGSPLNDALHKSGEWTVEELSTHAQKLITDDDISLVAVSCATGDPVAICATRETMALYHQFVDLSANTTMPTPCYEWRVSEKISSIAKRFITSLKNTTGIVLPAVESASAEAYALAAKDANLNGRCILIGKSLIGSHPFYHWYIESIGEAKVIDFWSSTIWTTEAMNTHLDWPAPGSRVGAPGEKTAPTNRGIARFFRFWK